MAELQPEHRAKLDGIVQQMTANGEPEENVRLVVNDFKAKYGAMGGQQELNTQAHVKQSGLGELPPYPAPPETIGQFTGTGPNLTSQGNEPGIPHVITAGLSKMLQGVEAFSQGTGPDAARGTSNLIEGGMQAATPVLPHMLMNAPFRTVLSMLVGGGVGAGSEAISGALGAQPEYAHLTGDVLGGAAGAGTYGAGAGLSRLIDVARGKPEVMSALGDFIPFWGPHTGIKAKLIHLGKAVAKGTEEPKAAKPELLNPHKVGNPPSPKQSARYEVQGPPAPVPPVRFEAQAPPAPTAQTTTPRFSVGAPPPPVKPGATPRYEVQGPPAPIQPVVPPRYEVGAPPPIAPVAGPTPRFEVPKPTRPTPKPFGEEGEALEGALPETSPVAPKAQRGPIQPVKKVTATDIPTVTTVPPVAGGKFATAPGEGTALDLNLKPGQVPTKRDYETSARKVWAGHMHRALVAKGHDAAKFGQMTETEVADLAKEVGIGKPSPEKIAMVMQRFLGK